VKKMLLKACERCRGDLYPDGSDRTGQTLVCLQCGVEIPLRRVLLRKMALQTVAAAPKAA
jgi:hypothetical protein